MSDGPTNTPPASSEPEWKREYDQQQRAGLVVAYKNRWAMLIALIGSIAVMVYAFIGPYGQDRYGVLTLAIAFAALFGAMFVRGNSQKARAAARAAAGQPAPAPSPDDARLMRKIRWLLVPGIVALLSKDFVSTTSPWHERLQIGGIIIAAIGFLSMPYVLMQEEIRRARREENEKRAGAVKDPDQSHQTP